MAAGKANSYNTARAIEGKMYRHGLTMNHACYNALIQAASTDTSNKTGKTVEYAKYWFDMMIKNNHVPDVGTYNMLIGAYARNDDPKMAMEFLEKIQEAKLDPDVTSWNSALQAFANVGDVNGANNLLKRMGKAGIKFDERNITAMVICHSKAGNFEKSEQWFQQFEKWNVTPTIHSYESVLAAFAQDGNSCRAIWWFDRMRDTQCVDVKIHHYNFVLESFARAGDSAGAVRFFDRLTNDCADATKNDSAKSFASALKLNVHVFGTLLEAIRADNNRFANSSEASENERSKTAIKYAELMKLNGIELNFHIYKAVMCCLAKDHDIGGVENWLQMAQRNKVTIFADIFGDIIEEFVNSGAIYLAEQWCNKTINDFELTPLVIFFHPIIRGHAEARNPEKAIIWFNELLKVNLTPTFESYRYVINALKATGRHEEAQYWAGRAHQSGVVIPREAREENDDFNKIPIEMSG